MGTKKKKIEKKVLIYRGRCNNKVYYRLSYDVVTCNVDRDVSTANCWSSSGDKVDVTYKSRCSAMIGWFSTAVIGAFRFSLFV